LGFLGEFILTAPKIDPVGQETLERLSEIDVYSKWQVERLKPFLGKRVLEIGSGIGNISSHLLDAERLVLTDVNPNYLSTLNKRFQQKDNVRIGPFDLTTGEPSYKEEKLDSIVSLNVLEHIEDDVFALKKLHDMLEPKGKLVLLVPAHMWLYGSLDKELGHFRRYTKKELSDKLTLTDFEVEKIFFFNRFAILGWWWNAVIRKKKILPEGQLSIFGKLVPLLSKLDSLIPFPLGISVIAVAQKK